MCEEALLYELQGAHLYKVIGVSQGGHHCAWCTSAARTARRWRLLPVILKQMHLLWVLSLPSGSSVRGVAGCALCGCHVRGRCDGA